MTEATIGFLFKIATKIPHFGNNDSRTLLRSYYTMRCKELTRGYGLPDKQFSSKVRCPHCCLEWTRNTKVMLNRVKLSKRQKKRIRSMKVNNFNRHHVESRKKLLSSNEMEQICSFCNHSTFTQLEKPVKEKLLINKENNIRNNDNALTVKEKVGQGKAKVKAQSTNKRTTLNNEKVINVYSNAFDIFSIKNENNTLKSTIKEQPKVIKNNKKKKDKFAGLCQKAVMASAKMKEEKQKSNQLNLFLKPST